MYSIDLGYKGESAMYLADTGSQEVASEVGGEESINMTKHILLKPSTLLEIMDHTQKDDSLQKLIRVIESGWP